MAKALIPAITGGDELDDYKKLTVAQVRAECVRLKKMNDELEDTYTCHCCGRHLPRKKFYKSSKTGSKLIPTCRECLYTIATGYDPKTKTTHETEETIKAGLKAADLPFIRSIYDSTIETIHNETNKHRCGNVWSQMIITLQGLPQYNTSTWEDSDDEIDTTYEANVKAASKSTRKFFGDGFNDQDYAFLQEQYTDWTTRHECKTKAQEEVFKQICFKQLELLKARLAGKDTKDLDKSFQEYLGTANLQPKQNSLDSMSDAQTFGTLIQKYENTRPLPDIDPELEDVDHIGTYIDVFFKGHMAKMLNLKNNLSNIYENFMKKYSVSKPEYDADDDSETLFDKIFGKESD